MKPPPYQLAYYNTAKFDPLLHFKRSSYKGKFVPLRQQRNSSTHS